MEWMGKQDLGGGGWARTGPRSLRSLGAVLVRYGVGGHDPLYTFQRLLWLLGGEETGGGRQEGDQLLQGPDEP